MKFLFNKNKNSQEDTNSKQAVELLLSSSACETEKLLSSFKTSIYGLSPGEVEERLETYGSNVVAEKKAVNPVLELLSKFANPLNILLLALAGLSFFVGDIKAAIVISIMVLLSVVLTFLQEHRSNKALETLRSMVSNTATVIRKIETEDEEDGQFFPFASADKQEVRIENLVPGDIIHLSAGDIIPADIRLISSKDLFINQSSLTGESLPVEKSSNTLEHKIGNPLDLANICYMGSNCVSGTATALVLLTGKDTFFGRLSSKIADKKIQTSFDKGINRFTWLMIRFMGVMVPVVFLINGFSKGNWFDAFLFAMAVAVGLTPEILPMIVTINLARGAISMSRNKVIVKRLSSIQNFGAMDILCCDKTGTLTRDKVILEKYVDLMGEENSEVLHYAYLNSFYQTGLKNLLDRAILEHGNQNHNLLLDKKYKKLDEIPFDFNRRRMSVILEEDHNKHIVICKGATEEMLSISNKGLINGHIVDLDDNHRRNLNELVQSFSEDGFRVIAVAYKEMAVRAGEYSVKDEDNMTMIGFMAFLDPPKDTAAEAIALLSKHGVAVKVLTGDGHLVTKKICKEVGLAIDKIVVGSEIDNMNDADLALIAEQTTIFAKLSPSNKERIVRALQNNGHVVGFLGDGINDAPALKVADVGISVDSAVDVAKESADIVLLEKSLLVLEKGIIKGRTVFGNITKYIKMSASSNFGNMFSVLGASYFLPFLPMLPIQILTNNLLYDFSQTAIATDSVDEEYLEKPRGWNIKDIARFMIFMGPISSIFDYVTYFIMLYIFGAWKNPALFQTGWFVESLISQTLIIHIIRTNKIPFIQSRASLTMTITSLVIVVCGIYLPFSMLAESLGLVKLPLSYFGFLLVIMLCYMTLAQIVKNKFITPKV